MIRRMFLKSLAPSILGGIVGSVPSSSKPVTMVPVHVSTEKGWQLSEWDDIQPGHYILLSDWDSKTSILRGFVSMKIETIEPGPQGKFTWSECRYSRELPLAPHQEGEKERLWKEGRVAILRTPLDTFPPLPADMMVKDNSPHVCFFENRMAWRIVCPRFPAIPEGNLLPSFDTDDELLAYAEQGK